MCIFLGYYLSLRTLAPGQRIVPINCVETPRCKHTKPGYILGPYSEMRLCSGARRMLVLIESRSLREHSRSGAFCVT